MTNEPTVTRQIDGYTVEWLGPHKLMARVTRLRMPSDGQVRGQLEIRQGHGDDERVLLVPTQFNFSSEPARAKYAKQLTEKLSVEIEWKEVFDWLSQTIQELARAGEQYVEIYPDATTPPPEQLIYGLLYKGVQNIYFGEKGVNKSTLAYLLGLICALPWHDNPLGFRAPPDSVKGLVLDWETDERIFRYCVGRLQNGMSIPVCSMFYRRCSAPLVDDIEPIQQQLEETKAELLIIDSLGAAAGGERGELKGSEAALQFNAALRRLKSHKGDTITSLILGQTAKGEDRRKPKTIFGSTYFTYYARNIFELCLGDYDLGDTMHLGLFHRECNLGKRLPAIGLRVEYDDDTKAINIARETAQLSEFSEKVQISDRIIEYLKDGRARPKQIVESLGVSFPSVSMALKRLVRQQKVRKIESDYALATFPDED